MLRRAGFLTDVGDDLQLEGAVAEVSARQKDSAFPAVDGRWKVSIESHQTVVEHGPSMV